MIPEVAVMIMMVAVFWYLTPSSLLKRYRCSEEYVTSMFRRGSAASCGVTVTYDMISGVWQCYVQGNECGVFLSL